MAVAGGEARHVKHALYQEIATMKSDLTLIHTHHANVGLKHSFQAGMRNKI